MNIGAFNLKFKDYFPQYNINTSPISIRSTYAFFIMRFGDSNDRIPKYTFGERCGQMISKIKR